MAGLALKTHIFIAPGVMNVGFNPISLKDYGLEGWLCPALFKYFKTAPREIYVRAEGK